MPLGTSSIATTQGRIGRSPPAAVLCEARSTDPTSVHVVNRTCVAGLVGLESGFPLHGGGSPVGPPLERLAGGGPQANRTAAEDSPSDSPDTAALKGSSVGPSDHANNLCPPAPKDNRTAAGVVPTTASVLRLDRPSRLQVDSCGSLPAVHCNLRIIIYINIFDF